MLDLYSTEFRKRRYLGSEVSISIVLCWVRWAGTKFKYLNADIHSDSEFEDTSERTDSYG